MSEAKLWVVPLTREQARVLVTRWHRHHRPPLSHKFSLGAVTADGGLVGVAIVGRPVARRLDDGFTLEVTRLATDGTRNACSALYGAAWRAARAMGYRRMVTYTQHGESGASLRAVGWAPAAELPPRTGWGWEGRPRRNHGIDNTARYRWEVHTAHEAPTPDLDTAPGIPPVADTLPGLTATP